ncbi:MAG TPA: MBL fold metallo-hydrolase, partial [Bryobacteraceae bacterium]|nr:MBL fold metallo-hydrolase [Bryobacteraceae bacterium]
FWGAARVVTGSMHQLTVEGRSYLLDCGLFQGRRKEAEERNRTFPFPCKNISAVLLSHAHIDHSGNLPGLVRCGFYGPIFTSPATADLCEPMLADSASLQEKDAAFVNKRNLRLKSLNVHPPGGGRMAEPLYTVEDAEATYPLFRPTPMHTPTEIGPGLRYQSFEAGHIFGSTTMLLDLESEGRKVRLGFTGDLGRPGLPIIRDPEPLPAADYLIMESTYGDRVHEPIQSVSERLAEIVRKTYQRGGKLIVPAFAVGRTQQLVLILHQLISQNKIPSFPIFVDSPLAVNVTEVFRKHPELFDEEASVFLDNHQDPFGFRLLTYVRDVNQSKALNDLRGPFMIVSASGMCEGGRILHHLRNNISDPRNTVLLTGYQAENTLGRKIEEGRPEVPIFGEPVPLRAEVEKLDALSGHADREELLAWMKPLVPGLKRVFLVHGESEQQRSLAQAIQQRYGKDVVAPERGQSFEL